MSVSLLPASGRDRVLASVQYGNGQNANDKREIEMRTKMHIIKKRSNRGNGTNRPISLDQRGSDGSRSSSMGRDGRSTVASAFPLLPYLGGGEKARAVQAYLGIMLYVPT